MNPSSFLLFFVLNSALAVIRVFLISGEGNLGGSREYSMQQAMYLLWRASHLIIWLADPNQALVISATLRRFSAEMTGAQVTKGKWIHGFSRCCCC